MSTPEGQIKRKLDKMLKDEGVWYFPPQAGPYGAAGIPDRVAIVCGMFVGIECKADAKCKLTALQERTREKIREAGGVYFVVYDTLSVEQVREFIRASCSGPKGSTT